MKHSNSLFTYNVTSFKEKLEEDASAIIDGNWLKKLHPVARSDVKSYDGDKICSLLQVIRNKIEHFEQIRNMELRKIYLGSPDGVVEYFTGLFPKLVPFCSVYISYPGHERTETLMYISRII
jgi:hypothetical protein